MICGDRFQTSVVLKGIKKILIAEGVNLREAEEEYSEYGCRFLVAATSGV
jgi:hypothetical protein